MNKQSRKWLGLAISIAAYFLIHEGAHLLYALSVGAFKRINVIGIGLQIETFQDKMSDIQIGWFCLVASMATLLVAYLLVYLTPKIVTIQSALVKTIAYYCTMSLLFIDPLYLTVLYRFVGGGDMNGIIQMGITEMTASIVAAAIFVLNVFLTIKIVLPLYNSAFESESK